MALLIKKTDMPISLFPSFSCKKKFGIFAECGKVDPQNNLFTGADMIDLRNGNVYCFRAYRVFLYSPLFPLYPIENLIVCF